MMRRSSWVKRTLCASLAILTTISMAGCKGGKENGGTGENGGNGKNSSNTLFTKEGIFKEETIPFSFISDQEYVMDMSMKDDGITVITSMYQGSASISMNSLKLYSVDDKGTVLSQMILKDSEYDEIKAKMDQDETETEDSEALPIAVGTAGDSEDEELEEKVSDAQNEDDEQEKADEILDTAYEEGDMGSIDYEMYDGEEYGGNVESLGFSNSLLADDGRIFAVKNHYKSEKENDEFIEKNVYSMCAWDKDGALLWEKEIPIPEDNDDEWYYVSPNILFNDKNVFVVVQGTSNFLIPISLEGEVGTRKDIPSDIQFDGATYQDNKGNMYVSNWSETGTELVCINLDTLKKTSSQKLPSAMNMNGYEQLNFIDDQTVVYCNDSGVYTYHFGDDAPKMIMNYINSDVNTNGFNELFFVNEDKFYAMYNETVDYTLVCSCFTRVDPKDVPDKEIIEIAGMSWIDNEMRERIIKFNKQSEKYKIVIRDYNQYNTEEDYNAGITQLNNDIIAGNIPDILVTDQLKVENYISKGLLVDIGEKIANDPDLSKIEFMNNVFDAHKVNGKLYEVIPSFMVITVIGKKSVVGNRTTWTMKEMMDTLKQMGPDTEAFSMMDRSSFLYYMTMFNSSDFVDRDTGKCNFASEQFIDCLEFAKNLPEEIDYENMEDNYWDSYQSQYRENRTMLMPVYITEFQYIKQQINGYMGEPVSYIGFPSSAGTGSVVNKSTGYAISAKSKNIDGCWEFLRQFLLDDYQKNLDYYLPVNKAALLEKSKEAGMKSFWIDENGKKVEYDDTFYINGEELVLDPLTQDQINELVDFIGSIKINGQYDEDISKIIEEESGAFFAGKKSAKEVADIIQSRVQVFINENR